MTTGLPQDIEAEASFLASCCAPGGDLAFGPLALTMDARDFMVPAHKYIHAALCHLLREQLEVSPLTIRDQIRKDGKEGECNFATITDVLSSPEMGRPHILADILRRKRVQRAIIGIGTTLAQAGGSDASDPLSAIAEARDLLDKAETLRGGAGADAPITTMAKAMDWIMEGRAFTLHGGTALAQARTGIARVDQEVEFGPGQITIIAGRPGEGKTTWGIQVAYLTAQANIGVPHIISLEEKEDKVLARGVSRASGLPFKRFRKGDYLGRVEVNNLMFEEGSREVLDRIIVDAMPAKSPWPQIEARIRRVHRERGTNCIILDYFGRIGTRPKAKGEREDIPYTEVIYAMVRLISELKMTMVLLCQLNREASDKEPHLSDLRDTGLLEAEASAVVMLYSQASTRKAKLAKAREGEGGVFELEANMATGLIRQKVSSTDGYRDLGTQQEIGFK